MLVDRRQQAFLYEVLEKSYLMKKPNNLLATFIFLCLASFSQLAAQKIVWEDNFDGNSLDYSKWECEQNAFGGGNNELQMYTDRKLNVRVENGNLILEARKENTNIAGTIRNFSSARIRSKNRGDWMYGRFDIRAKLPSGQGIWPAIWMLPTDEKYGDWASSGEIDILEFKGNEPNKLHTTLHFGGKWPNNLFKTNVFEATKDLTLDFHTYSLDWRKNKMTWFLDDKEVFSTSRWESDKGPYPAPFDQRFHLLLNVAVGGGFGGPVADDTPFPAQMHIDFVRVSN